jgi:hypothetical protein
MLHVVLTDWFIWPEREQRFRWIHRRFHSSPTLHIGGMVIFTGGTVLASSRPKVVSTIFPGLRCACDGCSLRIGRRNRHLLVFLLGLVYSMVALDCRLLVFVLFRPGSLPFLSWRLYRVVYDRIRQRFDSVLVFDRPLASLMGSLTGALSCVQCSPLRATESAGIDAPQPATTSQCWRSTVRKAPMPRTRKVFS